MTTLNTYTTTIRNRSGVGLAGTVLTLTPQHPVVGVNGDIISAEPVAATTAGNGALTVDLYAGLYHARAVHADGTVDEFPVSASEDGAMRLGDGVSAQEALTQNLYERVVAIRDRLLTSELLAADDPAAARAALDLEIGVDVQAYNAAIDDLITAGLQSGTSDTTAGRSMIVGAFGIGGLAVDLSNNDLDDALNGLSEFDSTSANHPLAGAADSGGVAITSYRAAGAAVQLATVIAGAQANSLWTRTYGSGAWSAWVCLTPDAATDLTSNTAVPPTRALLDTTIVMEKLSTHTASDSETLDIEFPSGFESIILECSNLVPMVDNENLFIRTSNTASALFGILNYLSELNQRGAIFNATDGMEIAAEVGSGAGEPGWSGTVHIHNPNLATQKTLITAVGFAVDSSGVARATNSGGARDVVEANDAVRVMYDGGIASGQISVYGLRRPD